MGDHHEYLCRAVRKQLVTTGFRETKSPMPTYRPDIFAQKNSKEGNICEELVVEIEIETTVFLTHSQEQLILMDEFLRHRRKKRIKVRGVLAVPDNPKVVNRAKMLLGTLFLTGTEIEVLPVS